MSDWYFDEEELRFAGREPVLRDLENDQAVAIANILAGGLMEVLCPCFWAALILLFAFAEFAPR
jgi:hypothetical protein